MSDLSLKFHTLIELHSHEVSRNGSGIASTPARRNHISGVGFSRKSISRFLAGPAFDKQPLQRKLQTETAAGVFAEAKKFARLGSLLLVVISETAIKIHESAWNFTPEEADCQSLRCTRSGSVSEELVGPQGHPPLLVARALQSGSAIRGRGGWMASCDPRWIARSMTGKTRVWRAEAVNNFFFLSF